MSVTQVHEALGSFEFELVGNVPRDILDTVDYFGHIAIIPGRLDPRQYGDNILNVARYVGVVRKKKIADDGRTNLLQDDIRISGVSLEFWLGDEDGKGPVIENETLFSSDTFATVIAALRPSSVDAGTIYPVSGSYSGRHQYETPRAAIQYVCQTMSTDLVPVGYRVRNTGALDAGPESDLFVTNPQCVIVKKGVTQGEDMAMRALPATMDQDYDMEDFTTRVIMIAEESESQLATGSADIDVVSPGTNIYKDLNGNPLRLTRLVSESDTIETNAATRAELALRNYLEPHRSLTIAADDYDIHGSFEVGDYVWVYDPDGGLVDLNNEVYVRGIRINPMKLRVTETDFPITEGYTVCYRDADGNWTDLTDYIHWEEIQPAQITIGDFTRSLTNTGESVTARVSSFVQPDASIPAAPTWLTGSFTTSNYIDGNGFSKGAITVVWSTPINQDSSAISDGDHYEINYRIQGQTDWSVLNVAWGTNTLRVADLSVATNYEFRVRGIDKSNNLGTWSSTTTVLSSSDTIAPSTPAPPTVAASTIAVQITHQLGKASGGTFNLEGDLAALEVHMSDLTGFTPSTSTYIGSLRANQGMMDGNIPAVGTFPVDETVAVYFKVIAVDTSGNKSAASTQASTSAVLVDSAHISELTVSKVAAGTISSNWLLGANIQTAASGQRVVINQNGIRSYDAGGNELVTIDAATGQFNLKTSLSGARMEMSANGIRTYDLNGDLSTWLSSDPALSDGDYISFRDSTGATLAAVDSLGTGTFVNGYFDDGLYIDGAEVRDLIDLRPRGVIALSQAPNDSATTTAADTAGAKIWNRIKIPNFDATRQYKVSYNAHIDVAGTVAGTGTAYVGFLVYGHWDGAASTGDPQFFSQQWGGRSTSRTDLVASGHHSFNNTSPAGTDLHLAFYVYGASSGIKYLGEDFGRVWVEDIGPALVYDVFDPSAGGGSGNTPKQTYTKTYSCTWSGRYNQSGSRLNSNGDIYQGYYDGTNGNQKSLIGFDYSTIASDLSGATISKVELTMTDKHWYYNDGGTAVIGTHNQSVSSAPASYGSTTANRVQSSGWPKGGTRTVSLGTTIGNEFRDGTTKGLCIGPGPSTSKTYYGYFAGQNSSSKPKLKITYTK